MNILAQLRETFAKGRPTRYVLGSFAWDSDMHYLWLMTFGYIIKIWSTVGPGRIQL